MDAARMPLARERAAARQYGPGWAAWLGIPKPKSDPFDAQNGARLPPRRAVVV